MKNYKDFAGQLGGTNYNWFNHAAPHIPAMEQEVGIIVAQHLGERHGRVLDIGVGTGDTTHEMLEACFDVEVVAIDIEEKMIEVCKERFAQEPRVMLVLANALDHLKTLDDNCVDVVVSGFCLHNIPAEAREAIMYEVSRALKPGDIFVTCDKIAVDDEKTHLDNLTKQILAFDIFNNLDRCPKGYREEWIHHYIADDQPGIKAFEAEWRNTLENLDFHSISFTHRTLMDVILRATKS